MAELDDLPDAYVGAGICWCVLSLGTADMSGQGVSVDLRTLVVSRRAHRYHEIHGRAPVLAMINGMAELPGYLAENPEIPMIGRGGVSHRDPSDGARGSRELVVRASGEAMDRSGERKGIRTKCLQAPVLTAIRSGYISGAHDASEGGLLVAIAESVVSRRIGTKRQLRFEVSLASTFGEGANIIVVSTPCGDAFRTLTTITMVQRIIWTLLAVRPLSSINCVMYGLSDWQTSGKTSYVRPLN